MVREFKNVSVKYIQLEAASQSAEIEMEFEQGKVFIETKMILEGGNLNQFFAKLSSKGISLSLSDDFEHVSFEEEEYYLLDFEKKGWDAIKIDCFLPVENNYRQIRA